MAITYRASFTGGDSLTTNKTCTFTPAVGDLLIAFVNVSGNTNAAPTMGDDFGYGSTWYLVGTALWDASNASISSVFVRVQLATAASSHVVTAFTGANTAGAIVVVACSGALRSGSDVVRSFGKQASQLTGTTPAPALNQAALTNNMTLTAVMSADTTTDPNASWTERQDTSQITPTTALEVATRDSGFTGTTITHASTQTGTYASWAIELDDSAFPLPYVDGFESGVLTVGTWALTRTPTVQGTTVHAGSFALKCLSDNSGNSNAVERMFLNSTTAYIGFYFRVHIATLPSGTVIASLGAWVANTAHAYVGELYITSTTGGALTLGNRNPVSGTDLGTPVSINADQWYFLEYRAVLSATVGTLEVTLDGAAQTAINGVGNQNTGTDNIRYWNFGWSRRNWASGQLEQYFDDISIDLLPPPAGHPAIRRFAIARMYGVQGVQVR